MMWRNRLGLRVAIRAPRFAAWLFRKVIGRIHRDPEGAIKRFAGMLPEPDRSVLQRTEVQQVFRQTMEEAFRNGADGAVRDLVLYSTTWDFALEEIAMPVHFWQGESDVVVPPIMARHFERTVPGCSVTFFPGEGHFSLIVHRLADILGVFA
jgi:pimeloyl-ACP methyl ester carboxylesterase